MKSIKKLDEEKNIASNDMALKNSNWTLKKEIKSLPLERGRMFQPRI